MGTAVVILSGSIKDYAFYDRYLKEASFIACGDGGAVHAEKMGINPNVILGDFDSITPEALQHFRLMGTRLVEYPCEKDFTDSEASLEYVLKEGYNKVYILGGTGSRLDHTFANLFLLNRILNAGGEGFLINENNILALIDKSITIERIEGWKVSLIPLSSRVEGIKSRGLSYALDDDFLYFGTSRGVSNEFSGDTAEISVKKGLLLVTVSRD